jgi:hypothetical protein
LEIPAPVKVLFVILAMIALAIGANWLAGGDFVDPSDPTITGDSFSPSEPAFIIEATTVLPESED